jgi:hypothetical protein
VKGRGVTLVEVVLASLLLLAILLITTGLLHTGGGAYTIEVRIRERQLQCQAALDSISKEVYSCNSDSIWACPVSGQTLHPSIEAPSALVLLSPLDASGRFVAQGTSLAPSIQRALAYVCLGSGAEVSLHRIDFGPGSWPSDVQANAPRISVSTTSVTLEWTPAGGGGVVASTARDRTAQCVKLVDDVTRFSVSASSTPVVWRLGLTVQAPLEKGRTTAIRLDTTARGRN